MATEDTVEVWLVERTYSDDEQNIIILTYATLDGTRSHRKERALTSFSETSETPVAVDADPSNLSTIIDSNTQEQYETEAHRMREKYDPEDTI